MVPIAKKHRHICLKSRLATNYQEARQYRTHCLAFRERDDIMKKNQILHKFFYFIMGCNAIAYILIGWGKKDHVVLWGLCVLFLTIISVCFSTITLPTEKEKKTILSIYFLLTAAQLFPAIVSFFDFSWYPVTAVHLLAGLCGCYCCFDIYKSFKK